MRKAAPLTIIFFTVFIDLIGFGMILPVLPYYTEKFGGSGFQVGLLVASFSLMQFLFAPVWGRISDRIGRRPILLLSLSGSAVALTLFGLAGSLTALFIARILAGIFTANIATAQAYIADITTPENRAKGMGLIGAAFGLGFIFGPTIGGVLSTFGLGAPGFFAAGLALLNTISAYFFLPESRTREAILASRVRAERTRLNVANFKTAIFHPLVGAFLLLFFFVTLAFANLEATFALMIERNFGYGPKENGYIFAYVGLIATIVNGGLIGPLVKRFGENALLMTGLLLQAMAFLLLPYQHSLALLLVFIGAVAAGSGLANPTLQSLISKNTDADRQGGVLGVSQSLGSLARVFGPTWGGFFFDRFGVAAPYWSGGLLLFICAGFSVYAAKRLRRKKKEQDLVVPASVQLEQDG